MIGEPLQIGPVRLATNLLLAPIAGYCDLAFRTICREQGGVGLACTDLLSPQGLLRGTATSLDLAKTDDADKPVGMQLYGSDPAMMAEGARWAVEHGATVVDINMGCPVDKVTKKDGGSRLLTDAGRAMAIVRACVRELEQCSGGRVPLTCKMRLCWHEADFLAGRACSPGLARALAEEGVAAVTVHGRTTEQKFSGSVRLEGIARVVEAVGGRIPVIGNGDVREAGDVVSMIRATGCRGVMIGRGALSTPWIFREAWAMQRMAGETPAPPRGTPAPPGERPAPPAPPSEAEKVAIIRRFFELMRAQRDDRYALYQIRRRITWFAKRLVSRDEMGRPIGCKPLKEAIRTAATAEEVHAALDRFSAGGLRHWAEEELEEAA